MEETNVSEISALAVSASKVPTDIPYAVVPRGYEIKPLENLILDKEQVNQSVNVTSVSSFVGYVTRFKDERSVIFADTNKTLFTARLDYHADSKTACKNTHKVTYDCPLSDEWVEWNSFNKKGMDQGDFAEFIENHIHNVAPVSDDNSGISGTELLEMVLAFQETRECAFKSVRRLQDGTFQMSYSDEKSGAGNTSLPEKITLALPPFHNGVAYQIDARIRYRLREGRLVLWYELIEPKKIIEHAYNEILVDLQNQLSDVAFFEGRI